MAFSHIATPSNVEKCHMPKCPPMCNISTLEYETPMQPCLIQQPHVPTNPRTVAGCVGPCAGGSPCAVCTAGGLALLSPPSSASAPSEPGVPSASFVEAPRLEGDKAASPTRSCNKTKMPRTKNKTDLCTNNQSGAPLCLSSHSSTQSSLAPAKLKHQILVP